VALCDRGIDVKRDRLEGFFRIFDTTDDQGWCDIGYETCERIVQSYSDDDWSEFIDSIGRLQTQVHLGVVEILPLVPNEFRVSLLETLLLHASDEAWLEAFTELSKMLCGQPELARRIFSRTESKDKFEMAFTAWVNFERNMGEDFAAYYRRYCHLIRAETQQAYEALCKIT
jgi:hypothetical protein